jgi:hypothetical protein
MTERCGYFRYSGSPFYRSTRHGIFKGAHEEYEDVELEKILRGFRALPRNRVVARIGSKALAGDSQAVILRRSRRICYSPFGKADASLRSA